MFGLIVFGLMGIYLLLLIAATTWAYRRAGKKGLPRWQRWLWAAGAFLVVYLPVFWDWLPTVVAHRYYCEKEAGFWVYKTLEQWKKENPGVMETLIYEKKIPYVQTPYGRAMVLNQRFLHIYKYEGPLLVNRWRIETEIRDSKNGEVIAREINFSTSQMRRQAGWSGWKLWLASERCSIEKHRDQGSFGQITAQVEGAKK
jgi:hypothetical protein